MSEPKIIGSGPANASRSQGMGGPVEPAKIVRKTTLCPSDAYAMLRSMGGWMEFKNGHYVLDVPQPGETLSSLQYRIAHTGEVQSRRSGGSGHDEIWKTCPVSDLPNFVATLLQNQCQTGGMGAIDDLESYHAEVVHIASSLCVGPSVTIKTTPEAWGNRHTIVAELRPRGEYGTPEYQQNEKRLLAAESPEVFMPYMKPLSRAVFTRDVINAVLQDAFRAGGPVLINFDKPTRCVTYEIFYSIGD